jgi:aminocarboxymuconate-semialdehyde decarboxylase
MPAETARAICSMIFGGIFERLPKLRVNFAHAGGSFFATIGRIEHGFDCRPDLVAIDNPINPRDYIGKFWVDSITHDPLMLDYVIKLQGSKKITFGTDYPFPLGDLTGGKFIEEMDISKKIKEDIFCNSTLEWLTISKKDFV